MNDAVRERLASVGALAQLGGTQLVTLHDGQEAGTRVVEFRTTSGLEFGVLVDRAFDIGWCRFKGRSIVWHSPTGFAGPWFREPGGLGFLRTMSGGLMVTCGLDHILFPATDEDDTYNYPGRTATDYGLHGRVGTTPARLLAHGPRIDGDDVVLEATGEVRQASTLGENLVMTRTVRVGLDGDTIEWTDEVRNDGWYPTPHMLLYHLNFGAPLIGPGTELIAPIDAVRFRTPSVPDDDEDAHLRFHEPRAGFVEQAFEHDLRAGADGLVRVALVTDDPVPWGVQLAYQQDRFPHFFQWRLLDRGHYTTGLEPSTNGLDGRLAERAAGKLRMLEPGETLTYRTSLRVADGPDAVAGLRAETAAA